MFYEALIAKALAEDKLYFCIVGAAEYHLASRDEDAPYNTNYETLLFSLDRYAKKHPEANLKEQYEETLRKLLASQKPTQVYKASKCMLMQIATESKPGFDFQLANKAAFLSVSKHALERNKQGVIGYIDFVIGNTGIGKNEYTAIHNAVDQLLSSMKR